MGGFRHLNDWLLDLAAAAGWPVGSTATPGPPPDRRPDIDAAGISDECDAFLTGRFHTLIARQDSAPAWVWVNALAHAGREDLERLGARSDPSGRPLAALSYLAAEVLSLCDHRRRDLSSVQREVLVPFELELADWPDAYAGIPALVAAIDARLARAMRAADRRNRAERLSEAH